jgi:hypothetical protein
MRLKPATALRLLALTFTVVTVWAVTSERFSKNISVPLQYEGDSLQILGWINAASELDYVPFASKTVQRLGAPYEANWNDYAMYEEIITFAMGLMAKGTGLMPATNLGVLIFSYLLSTLVFYACCRAMRFSRPWSFAAAILFGFTFYNTRRHIFHLLLSFSYVIPLSLLVCWLVLSSKRLKFRGPWFWFCVGVSFLMGLSNPYSLNIFLQLLCFSIALNWWRTRDNRRLKIGLLCIAAAIVGFLAVNLDTLGYAHFHGKNSNATPRNYAQTEMAALKPMEMVIPPPSHNSAALGAIGQKYESVALVKGELFSPYLGIVGIAGLIWMTGELVWLLLNRRTTRRAPAYVPQTIWILAYSVIGGVNNLFALAGLYLFRSTNRYSIFISALCLFFLTARMSRLTRTWSAPARWGLALIVMLIGVFDQLPKTTNAQEISRVARLVEMDAAFGTAMEKFLPKGTMVFQLPAMRFPEGGPVGAVQEYEMLRPYFHTKALRFSFGSNQGRPRDEWQWEVEKLPAKQMIEALERFGFGAIYLDRRGYSDRGEDLLKQFASAGKTNVIEHETRDQICISLNPLPNPQLPDTERRAQLTFRDGWSVIDPSPVDKRNWSGGDAVLSFFHEGKDFSAYTLRSQIGSMTSRRVVIRMKGQEIWSGQLEANQAVPLSILLNAKHGKNTIEFQTDQPPVRSNDGRVPLAFTLINPVIVRTSP